MKSNFNKIVLVSLADNLTKQVASLLSATLGIMFCDAEDLMEYELIDKDNLKKFASKEYLKNAEKKVAKHISSFEDVVVKIGFDFYNHNIETISKNALVIFLDFPKNVTDKTPNRIAYDKHRLLLENQCDFCISVDNVDIKYITNKILETLGGLV